MTEDRRPRPWSHDIPDGPWDYIVIGTGIGGMVSAALLSKLGRRVLVLEQHNIPGGFTQMFKRPGYRWDVGVHIVGEMSEMSYPGRLLKELTDGRLEWESVGAVYDEFNFPDGFSIQLPDSQDGFRETLVDYFPEEREAIDEYLRLTRAAARSASKALQSRSMPRLLPPGGRKRAAEAANEYLQTTTAEVLESLTDDHRLRAVLSAQWGYYGATPARSSFAMHALMVRHFLRGAYYPVGGSTGIAYGLLGTVEKAGGWTAVRRSVEEIMVRRGSVTGVRLSDGTEVAARRVISAAGAIPTSDLLKEGLPAGAPAYREPGPAHLSLYLGFKGDISQHGAERYCQWFFDTWDMETEGWDINPDRSVEPSPVLFCSLNAAICLGKLGRVDESLEMYEKIMMLFKDQLTEVMLRQYQEHYPELAPMIDHAEMSTPLSTNHFAASARGSIYGLGTTPARFGDMSLLPRTPVKGLYLGGVDVSTPGIAGGLSGGVMAAVAAEPLKGARFLQPLMKRPKV